MITKKFSAQSYRWDSFVIHLPDESSEGVFPHMRLTRRKSGNITEYTLSPGGEWTAYPLRHAGYVMEDQHSRGGVVFALANSGNWSGGGNYTGYIFGKPGAVVRLKRKREKKWIVFDKDSAVLHDIDPFEVFVEVI